MLNSLERNLLESNGTTNLKRQSKKIVRSRNYNFKVNSKEEIEFPYCFRLWMLTYR